MLHTDDNLSKGSLVLANMVPLASVLAFGWDAGSVMLLYWSENLVIGFYGILRIALLRMESPGAHFGKLFAIPFFALHFGGFCGVHGFFLLAFLGLDDRLGTLLADAAWPGPLVFLELLISVVALAWEIHPEGLDLPVAFLFLSHGVSFAQNYLGRREYTDLTIQRLMAQPYQRIVLLHVAIIGGGIPVMVLGSPRPLVAILVAMKIGMDLWLHGRSHQAVEQGRQPEEELLSRSTQEG